MKKTLVTGLALGMLGVGLMAGNAMAIVIDFDGLSDGYDSGTIADGYQGFNWENFGYIGKNNAPGSGYEKGVVSGDTAAYNEGASVASMTDFGFLFSCAYFTAAWNDGLTIDVTGTKSNGTIVTSSFQVDTTGPTRVEFFWDNLASLSFASHGGVNVGLDGGGEHFVVDNMRFNECCAVPEPATMLLFGTGLAGLAGIARRRKN
jgi:hypothetical protein